MNQSEKREMPMSEKLTQTFDDMEVLHKTFHSIEVHIDKEYKKLEIRMNPEKNNDISKELRFYMIDFLKNAPKRFESKNAGKLQ